MAKYVSLVKQYLGSFSAWKLKHITKDCNEKADALAVVAASLPITETVFLPIYYQPTSSIITNRVSQVDEVSASWIDPIVQYINTGKLPDDRNKPHKIQIQSTRFSLVNEQLFKRSLDKSYLKCLTTEQGQYELAKLHEGICGNHPSGRTLAHKAHTQGYYWPTKRSDVADYVRKCDRCQRLAPVLRSLAQDLISITSPWPYAQWGIDIIRSLPTALAQKKLLLVATDYFSKWIEAEAFASIKDKDVT